MAITLKQHASKQELLGDITDYLAHQSPQGNIDKLIDFIKTPLKRFFTLFSISQDRNTT